MSAQSSGSKKIWTSLLAVDGIGRGTFVKIRQYLARERISWEEWWYSADHRLWRESGLSQLQLSSLLSFQQRYTVEGYYEWLGELGVVVISHEDNIYPKLLKNTENKPIILFTKQPNERWNSSPIAIVGTRKISGYGRESTQRLVAELCVSNATIVSGFMYGVDEVAHRTAIMAGGYTVGVLGYGFQHVYPEECRQLFDEVLAAGGSFVTEYAPHVRPNRGTFPPRNRIIAGMSQATVVVEAAVRSGSHVTAMAALEYGRAVCAVPGPITNPYSEGTKRLINEGGVLVSSAADIARAITESTNTVCVPKTVELSTPLQQQLFSYLADAPSTSDALAVYFKQPVHVVQSTLSLLELDGAVRRTGAVWTVR